MPRHRTTSGIRHRKGINKMSITEIDLELGTKNDNWWERTPRRKKRKRSLKLRLRTLKEILDWKALLQAVSLV